MTLDEPVYPLEGTDEAAELAMATPPAGILRDGLYLDARTFAYVFTERRGPAGEFVTHVVVQHGDSFATIPVPPDAIYLGGMGSVSVVGIED